MRFRNKVLAVFVLIFVQTAVADRLKSETYAKKACEAMRKTSETILKTPHENSHTSFSKVAMSCARTLDDCLVENPSGYNDSMPWDAKDKDARESSLGWCDKAEKRMANNECESFLTKKIETHGEQRNDVGDPNSNNYSSRCLMKSWNRKLLEPVPGGGFFQRLFRRESAQPAAK